MWAQLWGRGIDRRDLLGKLAAAFSLAAVAPIDLVAGDALRRVATFAGRPVEFDEPALRYCEGMVANLRLQADVLGPRLTLHGAAGHRHLAEQLAALAPTPLRQRAVSTYAELTQLVGWLCFNSGDYRSAQHYYDEARNAAHEAGNAVASTIGLSEWQREVVREPLGEERVHQQLEVMVTKPLI